MADKVIKDILQRGTELHAPKNLDSQIITKWKRQKGFTLSNAPLIPQWVWLSVFLFFIGTFIWGFSQIVAGPSNNSISVTIKNSLRQIEFSLAGLEEIALSTGAVILTLIILNIIFLHFRYQSVRY